MLVSRKSPPADHVPGIPDAERLADPHAPYLGVSGLAAVYAGLTAMAASQIAFAVRAEGDFSFWGFAIIGSLMIGAVYGGVVALAAVLAWGVASSRSRSASGRAVSTVVAITAGVAALTVAGCLGGMSWALPISGATVVVTCGAATFLTLRVSRSRPSSGPLAEHAP